MYISQDPIGLSGGHTLYSYVHDLNRWVDVLGLAKRGGGRKSDPVSNKVKNSYNQELNTISNGGGEVSVNSPFGGRLNNGTYVRKWDGATEYIVNVDDNKGNVYRILEQTASNEDQFYGYS